MQLFNSDKSYEALFEETTKGSDEQLTLDSHRLEEADIPYDRTI